MPPKKKRPALHAATVLALLAGSAFLTVELRKDEKDKTPEVQAVTDSPGRLDNGASAQGGKQSWERLRNPDRSVLRTEGGKVLATFTHGARTRSPSNSPSIAYAAASKRASRSA